MTLYRYLYSGTSRLLVTYHLWWEHSSQGQCLRQSFLFHVTAVDCCHAIRVVVDRESVWPCGYHELHLWQNTHCSDVIMSAIASQITSLTIVYWTVDQSSASLAIVRGIHRWPGNSPHRGPVTRKIYTSVWRRYHEQILIIYFKSPTSHTKVCL